MTNLPEGVEVRLYDTLYGKVPFCDNCASLTLRVSKANRLMHPKTPEPCKVCKRKAVFDKRRES